MTPPTMQYSAVSPCFCGCLGFLHRHFPGQSPPSHPLDPSLHSQQQSHFRIAPHFLKLQLLATMPSRGPVSLTGVHMAAAWTVWFSFHGCQRSAVSLSALDVSPLTQDSCPHVGLGPLLQFPHPPRAGPTLLFFPPSSFILLSFARFCIFFSAGQVLLSTLSWCSACISVSEGVILIVSVKRDVLHVHLLLCHLVPCHLAFILNLFCKYSHVLWPFLYHYGCLISAQLNHLCVHTQELGQVFLRISHIGKRWWFVNPWPPSLNWALNNAQITCLHFLIEVFLHH